MLDKLHAGGMGHHTTDRVDAKPEAFRDSMAEAIEDAVWQLLSDERDWVGGQPFEKEDNSRETRDRRLIFVAIAQGVVNHLEERQDAFNVVRNNGSAFPDAKIEIVKE